MTTLMPPTRNHLPTPRLLLRLALGLGGLLAIALIAGCAASGGASPATTPAPTEGGSTTGQPSSDSPSTPQPTPAPDREVGNREGDLAPDFSVTSVDGETVTRDMLLAEGRPFILYFFATW